MQIHSISKLLALPLILIAVVIMYLSYHQYFDVSIYIFIPVTLLVVLYVSHGPFDHWWLSKFPIKFDQNLKAWLTKYFKPYYRLESTLANKFEYRMTLYLEGRLFKAVGSELKEVPEDVKCMIAAHGLNMTLGLDDYLIGDFDRIFLYNHPFPSPDHPYLHTVETNTEDGMIILSLEQATNALLFPEDYYNVVYHGYAEALIHSMDDILLPDCSDTWDEVLAISHWTKEVILSQTGLKEISILAVHISLYFSFPEAYKVVNPARFQRFSAIFNRL
ncbi:MAG: zinc-dependent peptidase [Saprospiraceae bacterium]